MPNSPAPYELTLHVLPEDIDQLNHVNNVVYLRWVQEAAIAHWTSQASPEAQADLFWVVVRHEIDYKRPALAGDAILARTWVGSTQGRTFERHTELLRAADRILLARARTLWCPMAMRTGRPTQVSDEVRRAFSMDPHSV
ncbi:acyl-CoA thioesterase [Mesoterricola silvestris]|uniref:Thioesterase n=1 Tax=Mesoterricola silvestris TaxID=2927979 RepID=A0AA48GL92_9BACT|nr:acyl-CoA thioesterase [Mesoterricola silvestris]BDU73452.1 thioesterase [Mesoterricola silvestris]